MGRFPVGFFLKPSKKGQTQKRHIVTYMFGVDPFDGF